MYMHIIWLGICIRKYICTSTGKEADSITHTPNSKGSYHAEDMLIKDTCCVSVRIRVIDIPSH